MHKKRIFINVILLASTLLFLFIFRLSPNFTQGLFQNKIFQIWRVLHDYTFGLLPIPSIYIALIIVFIILAYRLMRYKGWSLKLLGVLELILWLFCIFYISWGYNYSSIPVKDLLELELENPSNEALQEQFKLTTGILDSLSTNLGERTQLDFTKLEAEIRPIQESLLKKWGISTLGRVRVRKIVSGSLLINRTSGIYIPHAFEGHVDGGLYPIQWPFALAHEMAHGYGVTYESDCNFIAFLTCLKSENPILKYSAMLAYWRYQAHQIIQIDRSLYEEMRSSLGALVDYDLKQIRAHIDRYPDLMPKYRNIIYDNYLKSHGVEAGIKSYDRMLLLIDAWERKKAKD